MTRMMRGLRTVTRTGRELTGEYPEGVYLLARGGKSQSTPDEMRLSYLLRLLLH